MPFVSVEALNPRLTKVPLGELERRDALYRVPLIGSPSMRLVLIEMPPGFATTPHRHPGAGELFVILTGSGTFAIGDSGPMRVVPGDLLFARPDEVHAIEAGDDGLRFLAGVGPNEDRPDEEVQVLPEGDG